MWPHEVGHDVHAWAGRYRAHDTHDEDNMQIRVGYELTYNLPQPTPMILTLNVHHSRVSDLTGPDYMQTMPAVPKAPYRDGFGNWCTRLVAPAGTFIVTSDATVNDNGAPDPIVASAIQHVVPLLPEETLVFLLGSRYCETDLLSEFAWERFRARRSAGRACRRSAISCTTTSSSTTNSPARPTAWDVFKERRGVCRDFAHLAITLCRCMNIPARYCTGYLGDIGTPPWTRRRWILPVVRGVSRRRLAHVRSAQQHSAHRTRPDRARARRGRRRDQHDVWTQS